MSLVRPIQAGQSLRCSASSPQTASSPSSDRSSGRDTYQPSSYRELVGDAAAAVAAALEAGETRLEVEFPPTPGGVNSYKGSSDSYIDANIQLAITAGKELALKDKKRVHILVPDKGEFKRSYPMFKSSLELTDGLTLGYLRESKKGWLASLTGGGAPDLADPSQNALKADVYIATNASCIELTDIEKYVAETVHDKPFILWNMELDTLRADLGLFSFPPKTMQHNFLSRFKPVFYIRQRDYSKTVNAAPFLINYSGALFREYPGPWQVMLRQDSGQYACVAERPERYRLGQVKDELQTAMGLDTDPLGGTWDFLRRGYKDSTWWEDDTQKDVSANWRTRFKGLSHPHAMANMGVRTSQAWTGEGQALDRHGTGHRLALRHLGFVAAWLKGLYMVGR
ncbi:hypothetical protein WJX84_001350 [Apatococcus fuscideae]|uniref:DUF1995 domain-containing protein n=1 Tax=Apatococcus fuscideae TaxID=2026836 RepID=A0AAW1S4F8_9CHLO